MVLLQYLFRFRCDFFAGPMYSAVGKARLVSADQKKKEWNRVVTNLRKYAK